MTTTKGSSKDQLAALRRADSINKLRVLLPPGTTVYLIKKSHTAKLEFTIFAALLPVVEEGKAKIINLTRFIAYATGAAYRGWGAISTRDVETLFYNLSFLLHGADPSPEPLTSGNVEEQVSFPPSPTPDHWREGRSLILTWL